MTPRPRPAVPTMALRRPPPLPCVSCTSTLKWNTGKARLTTPISIHNVGVTTSARQPKQPAQNSALTVLRREATDHISDASPDGQRGSRRPAHQRTGGHIRQQCDHHQHQAYLGERLDREVG